jgi:hypothetical protein
VRALFGGRPVNGSEQLQPEGRLESLNQSRHLAEMGLGRGVSCEE